jgi:resuscitation-promoting factor RpfA
MISPRAAEAIETSDTDELIRVVDGLCASAGWDELVELKERCREAVGRGKQLWGVEEHIRYRLALEAPGAWAGRAVSEGVARFALGPLPEVAASTKTWAELEPYLSEGPWRGVTAAERVVRGDIVDEGSLADLPGRLLDFEPAYQLATYKSDKVETPSPPPPEVEPASLPASFTIVEDPQSAGALFDLTQPWVTESNGRCETTTVEGSSLHAIRALGLGEARVGPITAKEAMRWMAWAGASGGAHGRRRGAAAGRYGAWWTVATLSDLDWPPDESEIEDALAHLRFHWFDDGSTGTGWELRLAIEHVEAGLAWAVAAIDAAD